MQKKREQYQIDTLHTLPIVLLDILLVISANFLALLIRFDFEIQTMLRAGPSGRPFIQTVLAFIPLSIICTIAAFSVFKLYSTLWEFAGYRELFRVAFAAAAVSIVQFAIMSIFRYPIPRSFPFFTLF